MIELPDAKRKNTKQQPEVLENIGLVLKPLSGTLLRLSLGVFQYFFPTRMRTVDHESLDQTRQTREVNPLKISFKTTLAYAQRTLSVR